MLQRTTLGPPLSPPETIAAHQGAPAQVAPWLQYFLVLMIVVSAIACAFIWQANAIADIQIQTGDLRQQAVSLEQENARLMVQIAAFDSPASVKREAARLGLLSTRPPEVHVYTAVVPVAPDAGERTLIPAQLVGWANEVARLAGQLPDSDTERTP